MDFSQEATYDEAYRFLLPKIITYCYYKSHDENFAEEVAEEAFLLLLSWWERLNSHSYLSILSWLQTTSRNLIFKQYKKKKKELSTVSYEELVSQNPDIPDEDSEIDILKPPTYEEYLKAIKDFLSPEEFTLFYFIFVQELSCSKTAKILNMNAGTVKYRARRLRMKLKEFLNKLRE